MGMGEGWAGAGGDLGSAVNCSVGNGTFPLEDPAYVWVWDNFQECVHTPVMFAGFVLGMVRPPPESASAAAAPRVSPAGDGSAPVHPPGRTGRPPRYSCPI